MIKYMLVAVGMTETEKSVTFYRDFMGLKVTDESYSPNFVEFDLGEGGTLLLQRVSEPAFVSKYPDQASVCLNFTTTSLDEVRTKAAAFDVELVGDVRESPVGPYLAVRDPVGNIVEIIERHGN